jgi:hypothetical protein
MRPITVLPAIARITNRLLSERIQRILNSNPGYLHRSQRGFIWDGATDQSIDALLEAHNLGISPAPDLLVASYDQRKAYDSVQPYTVRASLERLNFPEPFIQYVLSGMEEMTSMLRTKHGFSDPFSLLSGVRQGDPLAPLIYDCVMDAFHAGLDPGKCPLRTRRDTRQHHSKGDSQTPIGHTICRQPNSSVTASVGYADDTAVVATDDASLGATHDWVLAFFGANALDLNVKKTFYTRATAKTDHLPTLPTMSAVTQPSRHPQSTSPSAT